MKILLNVSYTDKTRKFWQESYIKNKIVVLKDNQNIHDTIAEVVKENDGIVLLYKNKPRGNVFIDDKDGNAKVIGYIYRGSTEIYNDEKRKYEKGLFDVWVDIKEVKDFPIKNLDR